MLVKAPGIHRKELSVRRAAFPPYRAIRHLDIVFSTSGGVVDLSAALTALVRPWEVCYWNNEEPAGKKIDVSVLEVTFAAVHRAGTYELVESAIPANALYHAQ